MKWPSSACSPLWLMVAQSLYWWASRSITWLPARCMLAWPAGAWAEAAPCSPAANSSSTTTMGTRGGFTTSGTPSGEGTSRLAARACRSAGSSSAMGAGSAGAATMLARRACCRSASSWRRFASFSFSTLLSRMARCRSAASLLASAAPAMRFQPEPTRCMLWPMPARLGTERALSPSMPCRRSSLPRCMFSLSACPLASTSVTALGRDVRDIGSRVLRLLHSDRLSCCWCFTRVFTLRRSRPPSSRSAHWKRLRWRARYCGRRATWCVSECGAHVVPQCSQLLLTSSSSM
mmetsp:Transcript_14648/g.37620  ORF Transcript_14648/g.37620 Transcript_14648/m.37620 type:complete len:291 (-) Transcript_14648:1062-1934(-)